MAVDSSRKTNHPHVRPSPLIYKFSDGKWMHQRCFTRPDQRTHYDVLTTVNRSAVDGQCAHCHSS